MAARQMEQAASFSWAHIKRGMGEVEGFNAKFALLITRSVGTMACAYVFAGIALLSLPAAISSGSVIVIVSWVAQTFLQLVLLSIILVGQRLQAVASDARSEQQFTDTETIVDRLDLNTAGGIKDLHDSLLAAIRKR